MGLPFAIPCLLGVTTVGDAIAAICSRVKGRLADWQDDGQLPFTLSEVPIGRDLTYAAPTPGNISAQPPSAPLSLSARSIISIDWHKGTNRVQHPTPPPLDGSLCETEMSMVVFATGHIAVKDRRTRAEPATLQECLQCFCREEQLGANDKWYCSRCKEHKEAFKKVDLWRLPSHLVIHLKRFQVRCRVAAACTAGHGLTMPDHRPPSADPGALVILLLRLRLRRCGAEAGDDGGLPAGGAGPARVCACGAGRRYAAASPRRIAPGPSLCGRCSAHLRPVRRVQPLRRRGWRPLRCLCPARGATPPRVQLRCARSPAARLPSLQNGRWYEFDDSYCKAIDPSEIVTSAAYLLFYRRRDTEWPAISRLPPDTSPESVAARKQVLAAAKKAAQARLRPVQSNYGYKWPSNSYSLL